MKTKLYLLFLLLSVMCNIAFGQAKKIKINQHTFIIKKEKIKNEWDTKDDKRNVYLIENGTEKLVLTYFAYKDEGGDCNNLFWDKEWLEVTNNKFIVTTRHFQKTGLDPITEWEKKTFMVEKDGSLQITKHLYKKAGSHEWKTAEE